MALGESIHNTIEGATNLTPLTVDNEGDSFWLGAYNSAASIPEKLLKQHIAQSVLTNRAFPTVASWYRSSPRLRDLATRAGSTGRGMIHPVAGFGKDAAAWTASQGRRMADGARWLATKPNPVLRMAEAVPELFEGQAAIEIPERVSRLRIVRGNPQAVKKLSDLGGKVWGTAKNVAVKAGTIGKSTITGAAKGVLRANRMTAAVIDSLPGVVGGRVTSSVSHLLKGSIRPGAGAGSAAALGFAIGGMSDGLSAISDPVLWNNMFGRDSLDREYFSYKKMAKDFAGRTVRGTLRALDSATMGLIGVVPGLGSYVRNPDHTEAEVYDSEAYDSFMSNLDKASDPKEASRLAAEYNAKVMTNLAAGKDENGEDLYVSDRNGKTRKMSSEEGKAMATVIANANLKSREERAYRLIGQEKNIDVESVKHGLKAIDDRYNSDIAKFSKMYYSWESWAPTNNAVRGKTKEQWAESVLSNLERDWQSRRSPITSIGTYRTLIDAKRAEAMDVYRTIATGLSSDEMASRFDTFWNAQEDGFRENFDATRFRAQLARSVTEQGGE